MKQGSDQKGIISRKNAFVPRVYIAIGLFVISIFLFIDGARKPEYNKYLENQHMMITPSDYDFLLEGEDVKGIIYKEDVVDFFTMYDEAVGGDVGYLAVHTPNDRILFVTADSEYTEEMFIGMKNMMSGETGSPYYFEFKGYTLKSELLNSDVMEFTDSHIPEEKQKDWKLRDGIDKVTMCYICGFDSGEPYSKVQIIIPFIFGGICLLLAFLMLTKPADKIAYHVICLYRKIRKVPEEPKAFVETEEYKGSVNDPLTMVTPEQEQAEKNKEEEQKEDKE